jgi:hypothetical protein
MPLYGNLDGPTGNNKPKYANVANCFGVSATERANTQNDGPIIAHAGWVLQTVGTGGVATLTISNVGQNLVANIVAANGYVNFFGGGGSGANASYSANALNSNSILSVTILNPGSLYTSAPTANITNSTAVLNVTVGGRVGRRFYETLVAGGSVTGDDPADNTYFPGT